MEVRESHLASRTQNALTRRTRHSLQELRPHEQVAAVCYRFSQNDIEFLLVQTRRGRRWTFPKGSLEPGLTRSQVAALEAFEEAGVHGRIEEAPFARYVSNKRDRRQNSTPHQTLINAYLCEVLWLGPPEESKRNPRWFSAEKAKRRLRDDRPSDLGEELARVVDRAVARIERLRRGISSSIDPLQKVQFEADRLISWQSRTQAASFAGLVHSPDDMRSPAALEFAMHASVRRILQFVPQAESRKSPQLLPEASVRQRLLASQVEDP
jgi:8-oxo-dGTP pyrophosphatase MutT (NUDIX family)